MRLETAPSIKSVDQPVDAWQDVRYDSPVYAMPVANDIIGRGAGGAKIPLLGEGPVVRRNQSWARVWRCDKSTASRASDGARKLQLYIVYGWSRVRWCEEVANDTRHGVIVTSRGTDGRANFWRAVCVCHTLFCTHALLVYVVMFAGSSKFRKVQ